MICKLIPVVTLCSNLSYICSHLSLVCLMWRIATVLPFLLGSARLPALETEFVDLDCQQSREGIIKKNQFLNDPLSG